MSRFYVSGLYIYPVKSMKGYSIDSMLIDERGPANDRRWMLVKENGAFVTQREHPQMCKIKATLQSDGTLLLSAPDMTVISVALPNNSAPTYPVTVWNDTVEAQDAGDTVAQWLSQFLEVKVRLVYMPETTKRLVDTDFAQKQEIVSFSDAFPFLLISDASIDNFNTCLEQPITSERFRPNIMISGSGAFDEDRWSHIKIGDIEFTVAKSCARCVMPSIDPETAIKQPEVSRALAKTRRRDGAVFFGQNLLHHSEGCIHVNDPVIIIQEHE